MKKSRIDEANERWRDVPGFDGKYQASTEGRVRQVYPDGSYRVLNPFFHKTGSTIKRITVPYVVRMKEPNGHRTERSVLSIIAKTWLKAPPGKIAYHKNGITTENDVWNIGFMSRQELGHRFGAASNERCCCKVRGDTVLEYYRSAKAAAAANYICYDSVLMRCNGKVKAPIHADGTTFRWDEPITKRRKA